MAFDGRISKESISLCEMALQIEGLNLRLNGTSY